jgi:hypothetical protein
MEEKGKGSEVNYQNFQIISIPEGLLSLSVSFISQAKLMKRDTLEHDILTYR